MGTKIEWTDETWNPIIGCSYISYGCRNCYAKQMARRLAGNSKTPQYKKVANWDGTTHLVESALEWPLKKSVKSGTRVFVCSMSDLFHLSNDEDDILRIYEIMASRPDVTFQVLTKRPERMLKIVSAFSDVFFDSQWFSDADDDNPAVSWPLPNVWHGVSVEDQNMACMRIEPLMKLPSAVKYVSFEPLLNTIDLYSPDMFDWGNYGYLDWAIIGGESGPNASPMRAEWVYGLIKQLLPMCVPIFFKQWGAHVAGSALHGLHYKQFPNDKDIENITCAICESTNIRYVAESCGPGGLMCMDCKKGEKQCAIQ